MATQNAWGNVINNGGTITLNGAVLNLATDNSANTVNIGNGTVARAINIGTSNAAHTITIGVTGSSGTLSLSANSTMTISNASGVLMTTNSAGQTQFPLNSAFLGSLTSADTNATGNGATYTLGGTTALTEIFDQNNDFTTAGVFTAPVTSKYQLNASGFVTNTTIASLITVSIVSSNRTYTSSDGRTGAAISIGAECCVLADMDAADTATVTIVVTGEAGNTNTISGTNNANTFSGYLAF